MYLKPQNSKPLSAVVPLPVYTLNKLYNLTNLGFAICETERAPALERCFEDDEIRYVEQFPESRMALSRG
jgi:hypothetical protein